MAHKFGLNPEIEIKGSSLAQVFNEIGKNFADKPALNYMGRRMTYQELMDWAERFAKGLTEKGLGKSDVIAMNLPNVPHFVIAKVGAFKAGCIVSGLSPLFTPDEMVFQLNDSGARAMVSLDMMYNNVFLKITDQVNNLELVLTAGIFDFLSEESASPSSVPEGIEGMSFVDFCKAYPPEAPTVDLSPEDAVLILYTGGTTGAPKGAVLTNGNQLANLAQFDEWIIMEKGYERNLAAFPMFHSAGNFVCCAALYFGRRAVYF